MLVLLGASHVLPSYLIGIRVWSIELVLVVFLRVLLDWLLSVSSRLTIVLLTVTIAKVGLLRVSYVILLLHRLRLLLYRSGVKTLTCQTHLRVEVHFILGRLLRRWHLVIVNLSVILIRCPSSLSSLLRMLGRSHTSLLMHHLKVLLLVDIWETDCVRLRSLLAVLETTIWSLVTCSALSIDLLSTMGVIPKIEGMTTARFWGILLQLLRSMPLRLGEFFLTTLTRLWKKYILLVLMQLVLIASNQIVEVLLSDWITPTASTQTTTILKVAWLLQAQDAISCDVSLSSFLLQGFDSFEEKFNRAEAVTASLMSLLWQGYLLKLELLMQAASVISQKLDIVKCVECAWTLPHKVIFVKR